MDFPRLSAEQRNSLELATQKYADALPESPAISYLEKRGISLDVAVGFRLGYVKEAEPGHEQAEGRLAIPYLTPTGVVDIRFRLLRNPRGDDGPPKYLSAQGSRARIYNARALHESVSQMAICEGELDAVVLSGLCGIPAVAIAGVSAWSRYYRYCFSDYEDVWIVMDPDDPGRAAANKIRSDLFGNGRIITLPMDVNDTYLKHDDNFIRKALGA